MAVRNLSTYPDSVLAQKALPADLTDGSLQVLIDDMIETMYSSHGIGLAAPQVGVPRRVIIVETTPHQEKQTPLALVNPEIVVAEGLVDSEEGCLSVPQYIANIKRADRVVVRGFDRDGVPVEIEATGLLARAFQHEIDHLDGVLIIDRLSAIKREFFKKRYQKAAREAKARA